VDEALDSFMKTFTQITDKHIPLLSKRVKRSKQPGWINDEILQAINLRDDAKTKRNELEYKRYRNLTTNLIK
jgi:hypothetical protein